MERRGQDRIGCDFMLNKVQGGHTHVARAVDISLNGMKLQRLLEPLAAGAQQMRLQFELPEHPEPIWVGASVVWEEQESDTVGVRFTDISHHHFQRLRSWLESLID